MQAKVLLQPIIDARIDKSTASRIPRGDIAAEIKRIVTDVQQRGRLSLNVLEARDLVTLLVNEAVGSSTGAPAENQSSGQRITRAAGHECCRKQDRDADPCAPHPVTHCYFSL
ncbi:MAG: hypothetical protein VCC99_05370, partial [Alphaproteobacteria bacterium]